MAYVQMEKSAGCALLTIDRPQVLNALSPAVLTELAAVEETKQATDVKAVVITGAGNKAFVARADIAAMKEMSPAEARAFLQKEKPAFRGV
jgi:enoyl-CoA hydratase